MNLTFLLDQLASKTPGGIGRYAANLAVAMLETTPEGHTLVGNIGRISKDMESSDLKWILANLDVKERDLPVQASNRLWELKFPYPRVSGFIHAPSLAAPLRKASPDSYVVPTIHDTVPWSHPETMTPHGVVWHRKMLKLAWKFAPAIAVPTNAVASDVLNIYDFGDRLHVLPGASSLGVEDSDEVDWSKTAEDFGINEDFILTVGTIEPRKGIQYLVELSKLNNDFQVVHAGPQGWGQINTVGTTKEDFTSLGRVSDAQLRELYKHARCLVLPSRAEGFGLPVVEAMSLGCPVITTDDPALREVAGGLSTILSPHAAGHELIRELQDAVRSIPPRAHQRSSDRANLISQGNSFSWASSAQKAWEIHTELMS